MRNDSKAFSIIEVLIAIVILGMAFISFFSLFGKDVDILQNIRDYSIAMNLAEELVHEYITDINELEPGKKIDLLDKDITPEIKSEYLERLDPLVGLEAKATVRLSSITSGLYEIYVRLEWGLGRRKHFELFDMKEVPEKF